MKILSIFGTRPEAIKMAPILKELEKNFDSFRSIVCITAQHRQMLDQVLDIFEIRPDYDLQIMQDSQNLFDVTCLALDGLKRVIENVEPEMVFIQGDTTTTMAAAISAYYFKTKVAHVEAGLRTGNKYAPFPEEINRKITSAIADIHFAPTDRARQNLLMEGVSDDRIFVTGNTVIDALFLTTEKINANTDIKKRLDKRFSFIDPSKRLILVTGHRRENFGEGLENICYALLEIARACPDTEIVYPAHLNPNVQEPVLKIIGRTQSGIHVIEPVDYISFVYLMNKAYIILTDSGGIQEEAPSLGKPVLVMRDTTERPEAVDAGTARLVGTDKDKIVRETIFLLHDKKAYNSMKSMNNPYGDGKAAKRIVDSLFLL
ncbi:MAG TPA: UDP-N-acetylglucosamine 2-epimerase (non-hydrolyzing) [Syntrophorhabdaceae bacterium]|nr:UDP-N-acetylglucosamine 2-epimerase (non-hydrolyzing) [Syntrophorhabdaceae bacterium]